LQTGKQDEEMEEVKEEESSSPFEEEIESLDTVGDRL